MKKIKKICAIDPGVGGALGVLDFEGNFLDVIDLPTRLTGVKKQREMDPIALAILLNHINPEIFILEKVHAMPSQGVTSTMNFGINFGILKGAIGAFHITPTLVTPQKWKKHFDLIGKSKDDARLFAQRIFPTAPLNLKKHVDRADALLMARWYYETQLKKGETT